MTDQKKLRLIQVAKEFQVGLNTLTDFMQKKGIKSNGSPNTLVESDVYSTLEKEFGGNRSTGSERNTVRERISQKQATVSINEVKTTIKDIDEEVVIIKSNIIEVKNQFQQPKVLGRIELKPKPTPTKYKDVKKFGAKTPIRKETPKVEKTQNTSAPKSLNEY